MRIRLRPGMSSNPKEPRARRVRPAFVREEGREIGRQRREGRIERLPGSLETKLKGAASVRRLRPASGPPSANSRFDSWPGAGVSGACGAG